MMAKLCRISILISSMLLILGACSNSPDESGKLVGTFVSQKQNAMEKLKSQFLDRESYSKGDSLVLRNDRSFYKESCSAEHIGSFSYDGDSIRFIVDTIIWKNKKVYEDSATFSSRIHGNISYSYYVEDINTITSRWLITQEGPLEGFTSVTKLVKQK